MYTIMKTKLTLLLIVLFPALVMAQNSAIDKVFQKYGDRDGFTVVTISKGLLKMVANADDDKDSDFLKKLNQIKVLACEDDCDVNLYDEVLSGLNKSEYEELMTAKSKGEDVLMLAKKDGDVIEELIILVGGNKDNALVYISGRLNMKDIGKLGSDINIHGAGLEHLKDIDK
jgi:hypothetical protein